jgi:hypothetical protein
VSYTRIPQSNTSRNENQLRQAVDALYQAHVNIQLIVDKMAQMNLDGGGTRIAAEYNLSDEAEASDIYSLINSTGIEIRDQSPFQTQLKQRLG